MDLKAGYEGVSVYLEMRFTEEQFQEILKRVTDRKLLPDQKKEFEKALAKETCLMFLSLDGLSPDAGSAG